MSIWYYNIDNSINWGNDARYEIIHWWYTYQLSELQAYARSGYDYLQRAVKDSESFIWFKKNLHKRALALGISFFLL